MTDSTDINAAIKAAQEVLLSPERPTLPQRCVYLAELVLRIYGVEHPDTFDVPEDRRL